ncbi:CapA [Desulforapulum autotrophicum HRM2]|uniref:CapA n=1 Tax=Desulforapulum autotrophicum (strain ATCC 43914 / DSM 3382 / VKM B-1955 / HRM2) TaxID=177437 RepID=C0QCN2_DESAH|nr:CapA family protein [Desulforapulum autotrophicum]ACN15109.1 CapA [Desulforapulum autotrophicum HRM2]
MNNQNTKKIRFAAVGDLLLTARSSDRPGRGIEALAPEIVSLFKSCDVVFANLECTLPGKKMIPTEPRVLSTEHQVRSLQDSGIDIVSLGNNHTFDCFDEGFLKLSAMLTEMGIKWCGAGLNLEEALNVPIIEVNGLKIAFLCVVDRSTGPSSFATEDASGVAPLKTDAICRMIEALKLTVDHIIVSPHWGMERFRIPSLLQIEQAHTFVNAGASMVLGHHPHVLQGMEFYHGVPVVYSLGNFIASHVYWENGEYLTWNKFERTGCILLAELDSTSVFNVEQIPVIDDGNLVSIEKTRWGRNCTNKVNRLLEKGVTQKKYKREAFFVGTIKPILSRLKWAKLKQTRPKDFKKLFHLISKGVNQ